MASSPNNNRKCGSAKWPAASNTSTTKTSPTETWNAKTSYCRAVSTLSWRILVSHVFALITMAGGCWVRRIVVLQRMRPPRWWMERRIIRNYRMCGRWGLFCLLCWMRRCRLMIRIWGSCWRIRWRGIGFLGKKDKSCRNLSFFTLNFY